MRTRPVNIGYLVVGLVFLGIAGSWALRAADLVDIDSYRWLLPLTLVGAGLVGLVASAAKGIRNRRTPQDDDTLHHTHDRNDNSGELT